MSDGDAPCYLSSRDLDALSITSAEAVDAIERLIVGRAAGRAWSAPKSALLLPDGRFLMSMLAAADEPPFVAVKSLALNSRNPERGHPLMNSLVTLLDSDTGRPLAVIDGNWITAARTAALSGVAAKRLAKPDSAVVAFIGCGVQARSHLRVLADLFPLRELRAFGRGRTNRDALCRTGEAMGLLAIASESACEAVCGADLIVSAVTVSLELAPFIDAGWLSPGAFAAVTDLALPWIPEGMSAFDRIVIDDLEQESVMPQPMVRPELVSGDITGLVQGDVGGRTSESERTAFVFRGLALADLALAGLAYRRASE